MEKSNTYEDEEIEKSLVESLYKSDPSLLVNDRGVVSIGRKDFKFIDYLFNNKIFGTQIVRHAYLNTGDYVFIFCCGWPETAKIHEESKFPRKHMAFLNGLKL